MSRAFGGKSDNQTCAFIFAGNAISNAIDYAKFFTRSHNAVIRVCDAAGSVIETHKDAGEFKEWLRFLNAE